MATLSAPSEAVSVALQELGKLPPQQQLRLLRIRRAQLHPNDFNEYCFRTPEGAPWQQKDFHRQWLDELMRYSLYAEQGLQHKVQIEAFRESAKTEQVSIGYVLWRLGKNPNLRVKIVSADDDLARAIIATAGQHIKENPRLHEVFPKLRPAQEGTWNSDRLIVERSEIMKDASLEAHGVLSSGVGGRCDELVFDDVCNFRNTTLQPAMKEQVRQAVQRVWMRLATPSAQIVWLDTPWAPDDASTDVRAARDFVHIRHSVYKTVRHTQTGAIQRESRWPEKYSLAFLQNEETERPIAFRTQMLLQAQATSGQPYFPTDVLEACRIPSMLTNDPTSRYSGMGLGPAEPGHVYVTFWDLGRHTNRRGRNATVSVTLDVTSHPVFIRQAAAYYDIPYTSPSKTALCAANEIVRISRAYPGETIVEVNAAGEAVVESIDTIVTPFRTTVATKQPMLQHLLNELTRGAILWQACAELMDMETQLQTYTLQDDSLAQDWVIALAGAATFVAIEGGSGIVI